MKKLLLLAAFAVSYSVSAQGDLYIQNYTDTILEYTIWKNNQTNVAGNCTPTLESKDSVTGLSVLGPALTSGGAPREAYYQANVNTSLTFNALYPDTPLIDRWILNQNYTTLYTPPTPVLNVFSMASQWSGIKFGVNDLSGTAIGGYYTMGKYCGQPVIPDLSYNAGAVVGGAYFTVGGATYIVIF